MNNSYNYVYSEKWPISFLSLTYGRYSCEDLVWSLDYVDFIADVSTNKEFAPPELWLVITQVESGLPLLARALRARGISVVETSSHGEAKHLCDSNNVGCVISDCGFPQGITGFCPADIITRRSPKCRIEVLRRQRDTTVKACTYLSVNIELGLFFEGLDKAASHKERPPNGPAGPIELQLTKFVTVSPLATDEISSSEELGQLL